MQRTTTKSDVPTVDEVNDRVARLLEIDRPRYRRLWAYCRNPMRTGIVADESGSEKPYLQAQEWGLPSRITGVKSGCEIFGGELIDGVARKEVVVENDIGWRIDTMVDYLFGKPLVIESAAIDPRRKQTISNLLRLILAHNGGIVLLQQIALLGCVYGFVDVLVKLSDGGEGTAGKSGTAALGQPPSGGRSGEDATDVSREGGPETGPCTPGNWREEVGSQSAPPRGNGEQDAEAPRDAEPAPVADESLLIEDASQTRDARDLSPEALERLARLVRLEIVEPARALPFVAAEDWRLLAAYGQVWETARAQASQAARNGWMRRARKGVARWLSKSNGVNSLIDDEKPLMVEVISADRWQRFRDGELVAEGINSLGRIPVAHVQNTAVPFEYSGLSDVEPLIPLQDELNIRLSDRANRITLQSFKMYLGKGIEGFTSLPIAPGRMWATENDQAQVIEFGGDASCPSEDAHIADLREALDKTSSVTPIAAGAIKDRIGNLTSAAALRITMQALLSKTEKKRTTYGAGIDQICELALAWLDRAGLFATSPQERRITLSWPSPLPDHEMDRLAEAEAKLRVGVSTDVVLRELGY